MTYTGRLGAVLIAKNEAAVIERCLSSLAAVGVKVVCLLDTGSTDDTTLGSVQV